MVGGFASVRSTDSEDEPLKEHPLFVRHKVSCQACLHCRAPLETYPLTEAKPFCQHGLGRMSSKLTLPSYRIKNWSDYNSALKKRGFLMIWFDPGAASCE